MLRFALIVSLVFSASVLAEPTIKNMWMAKALEAVDKAKEIQEARSKLKPGPERDRASYQTMIEFAFALHLQKDANLVQTSDSNEFFHVLLKAGEKEGLFDLVYSYPAGAKAGTPAIGARIDRLPAGWQIIFVPTDSKPPTIMVLTKNPGAYLLFSVTDPFSYEVAVPKYGPGPGKKD